MSEKKTPGPLELAVRDAHAAMRASLTESKLTSTVFVVIALTPAPTEDVEDEVIVGSNIEGPVEVHRFINYIANERQPEALTKRGINANALEKLLVAVFSPEANDPKVH